MFKKITLILLLSFLIFGCGKTNLLQWAKPTDKTNNIEQARKYIDEGDYDKAASLVQNSTSKEGKILYAECLMGQAGVDLSTIIAALNDESITNNYVIRLEKLINDPNDRAKILEAADIFGRNQPSKTSDIIVGTLCTMIGHVAFVKNNFDKTNQGLLNVANTYAAGITTINYLGSPVTINGIGSNVYPEYNSMGNPFLYIGQSAQLLSNIQGVDQSIKDAVTSFNAAATIVSDNFNTTFSFDSGTPAGIVTVNLGAAQVFPWSLAKPLFLM